MKKAVGEILWHCTDFDSEEFRHRFCPLTPDSWCKFQKDKITGKTTHKNTINIPMWINKIIKPIFESLSSDSLLSKCLHGDTQNSNESLNNVIWVKCPKNVFVHRPVLELGVYSAVVEFNEGGNGISKVFNHFGINGFCTGNSSFSRDKLRNKKMANKSTEQGQKSRKHLRAKKKGLFDKEKETEPVESYVAGGF